jgi:ribonuclease-3
MLAFLRRWFRRSHPVDSIPLDPERLDRLQDILNYRFRDPKRLVDALVHRSFLSRRSIRGKEVQSNERLEFLGDAVLALVVNHHLFEHYPDKSEGELTKMKSVIVSKQSLAYYAKKTGLGEFILLSANAQKAGVGETDSVLADTLEAIFGAVFLDGGFEKAKECIHHLLLGNLSEIVYNEENVNYKSLLQEYIQALHKVPPRYRVAASRGPDHDKEFLVEVMVKGTVLGRGKGRTKKHAEQEAAREAYRKLVNAPEQGSP